LVSLAGAVVKTTIQVGARIAAIGRFRQLSAAIGAADARLGGFGKTSLLAAGHMSLLGVVLDVARHPLAQIAALLETGVASAQWVSFTRGARAATAQLRGMGLSADDAQKRIREVQTQLGLFASRDMFAATQSFNSFNKLSAEWRAEILRLEPAIKAMGLDFEVISGLMAEVITEGKIEDVKRLAEAFGIDPEDKTAADVLAEIGLLLAEPFKLTNFEQMGEELGKVQSEVSLLIGPVTNAMAAVPLAVTTIVGDIILGLLDIVTTFKENVLLALEVFGDIGATIGESILLALEGEWEKIPDEFRKLWDEKLSPDFEKMAPLIGMVAGGVIGAAFAGYIGAAVGAALGGEIAKGLAGEKIENEVGLNIAMMIVGGLIGLKFAGYIGAAVGANVGFAIAQGMTSEEEQIQDDPMVIAAIVTLGAWIGGKVAAEMGIKLLSKNGGIAVVIAAALAVIALELTKEEGPGYPVMVIAGAALGAAIGTLIAPGIGTAIGAAAGAGIAAMVVWLHDPENRQRIIDIGKDIGSFIVDGISYSFTELFRDAIDILKGIWDAYGWNPFGGMFGQGVSDPNEPGPKNYAHGGVVPGPIGRAQLAIVHGGETVIPAGRGQTIVIPVYIGDRKVDEVVADSMGRITRQSNVIGRRLGSV